ncbi:hypothetical protein OQJ46_15100 [Microbulbifer thermotolerans]|uniref:hypothetical protein n=1 Tax=Microbulbifer thermotolerans TaxID=252514 RepID=UPI00224B7FCC|nr:hypothetical protein [Microbulbifer thermotolerans]MCX2784320.1 hypothetical protein [Microbulbifer thermotolerans]WKT61731.1 hypothetical protein Q2E61_05940 [Microbulbifer thermotolerans]
MKPSVPKSDSNRRVIDAAREVMARRDRELDGETLASLRCARARALEAQRVRAPEWLPAGAAVAAAVVVALLWTRAPEPEAELFAGGEWLLEDGMEIELMEEMDFYQWLAEEALDDHSS